MFCLPSAAHSISHRTDICSYGGVGIDVPHSVNLDATRVSLERERLGYDCNLGSLKRERALRHLAISPSCLSAATSDFTKLSLSVFGQAL